MKIAIYSPYLDTLGGGEKYMMSIAQALSKENWVDVLLDSHLSSFGAEKLKKDLSERFDLALSSVNFIKAPMGKDSNSLERLFFLRSYNLLFYLTDGSIFFPTAKKNILHIQSPLVGQAAKSVWGKIKLAGWNLIIYNSKFTRQFAEKNWPKKSVVIYPPVDVGKIKPKKKKNFILSVGRFFSYLKGKKQELLINTFRELCEKESIDGWSLHLVGSASDGDKSYIDNLRKVAKGLPVNFYPNLQYNELINLYGQSSIYWHASGFGENDPTKMEHFGISTVEAMAGGCVPVAIARGGQREIVEHNKSGYLWENLYQLKQYTLNLIKDIPLREKLASEAVKRAKDFSAKIFNESIIRVPQTV